MIFMEFVKWHCIFQLFGTILLAKIAEINPQKYALYYKRIVISEYVITQRRYIGQVSLRRYIGVF